MIHVFFIEGTCNLEISDANQVSHASLAECASQRNDVWRLSPRTICQNSHCLSIGMDENEVCQSACRETAISEARNAVGVWHPSKGHHNELQGLLESELDVASSPDS